MARRRRLFKYGPERLAQRMASKIPRVSEEWVSGTVEGIQTRWVRYAQILAQELINSRMPPRVEGDIDANLRRVRAAIEAVRRAKQIYEFERKFGIPAGAPAPTGRPVTAVTPTM